MSDETTAAVESFPRPPFRTDARHRAAGNATSAQAGREARRGARGRSRQTGGSEIAREQKNSAARAKGTARRAPCLPSPPSARPARPVHAVGRAIGGTERGRAAAKQHSKAPIEKKHARGQGGGARRPPSRLSPSTDARSVCAPLCAHLVLRLGAQLAEERVALGRGRGRRVGGHWEGGEGGRECVWRGVGARGKRGAAVGLWEEKRRREWGSMVLCVLF